MDDALPTGAEFTVRRKVRFGDADPAGIVFTPNFLHFAMDAMEDWFEHVVGVPWLDRIAACGVGTPAVSCTLEFKAPVRPGQTIDMRVALSRIGNRSFTSRVKGYLEDGTHAFVVILTFACMDMNSRKPISVPPEYRQRFSAHLRPDDT